MLSSYFSTEKLIFIESRLNHAQRDKYLKHLLGDYNEESEFEDDSEDEDWLPVEALVGEFLENKLNLETVLVGKKLQVLAMFATKKRSKDVGKRENVVQFAKSLSAMNTVYRQLNVLIALNKSKYILIYLENYCNCLFINSCYLNEIFINDIN